MKKKLLIAAGIVGGLILIFLIVVALQPSHYQVQRSATIEAPAATVFQQINDFHHWEAWSPWAKLDPKAKNTFSGPESGKGAVFAWDGNDDVGEGQMTILDSRPAEAVKIELKFIRPMEGVAFVDFALKPEGAGTQVTWTMQGENNFVGKAFCLFMNMDKMIGGDFEKGLAQLKTVSEAAQPKPAPLAPTSTPEPAPTAAPSAAH